MYNDWNSKKFDWLRKDRGKSFDKRNFYDKIGKLKECISQTASVGSREPWCRPGAPLGFRTSVNLGGFVHVPKTPGVGRV